MNKVKDYLIGVAAAALTGLFIALIGLVLTITVIGAIIGIPIMVVGILQIFLSPFLGSLFVFKRCPYCDNKVLINKFQKSVKCSKCKKRLIVEKKRLEIVK